MAPYQDVKSILAQKWVSVLAQLFTTQDITHKKQIILLIFIGKSLKYE